MKVAVFGLGYVGTVTAACLASHDHDVWGVDVDPAKVDDIRAGRSPVAEPGLDALIAQAVSGRNTARHHVVRGRARRGRDLAGLRGHTVDRRWRHRPVLHPPLGGRHRGRTAGRGAPGLWSPQRGHPQHGAAGHDRQGRAARADHGPGRHVRSPRRGHVPGVPPRGLRGGRLLQRAADGGGHLGPVRGRDRHRPVRLPRPTGQVVEPRTAEALKYACNAFHATKVSFANEMARLFRLVGVDSREVMSLFCEDRC